MLPFFTLAAVSPTRRHALRTLLIAHVAALGLTALGLQWLGALSRPLAVGNVLLIAGIIEGALLIGWRLTQLPKSQALEFLLVSPLRPGRVLLAEALVGLARLALVTLSGLPLLLVLIVQGTLYLADLPALLLVPFAWGAVTGLGLTAWAYEPHRVRRWGERVVVVLILVYLVVGVLAAEHLPRWLAALPPGLGRRAYAGFQAFHEYNPFGVMRFAMEHSPAWAQGRVEFAAWLGFGLALALLLRAAGRLQAHFQEWHYKPATSNKNEKRAAVGDRPLTWWAVKRVSRYSGRINLWLAGGFGVLFAVYTVFADQWPAWLGRQVFTTFENLGGIPMLTTALVLLAAVPAAFQYGLWDSNTQDRCRRLELLLLTHLDGRAYWHAAAGAAWQRGRGYFAVALVLWLAAAVAGKLDVAQALAAMAAGVILWGLYFALGFRAFAKGMQANTLGIALTLLVPIATWLLLAGGWPVAAAWLPPGSVFRAAGNVSWSWLAGPVAAGVAALWIARVARTHCDAELRRWYEQHHGLVVSH
ncbi:MAG: hypothetical protein L0Y71_16315 [Gemmataceae bacterium]|nr:hypothetical protein [Gemmataceae bacterium]